ncbi:MAG: hypothetical protein ACLRZ9_06455 [Eubacterium sp.]
MNIRFLAQSEYFNGIHLKDDIILEKEYEQGPFTNLPKVRYYLYYLEENVRKEVMPHTDKVDIFHITDCQYDSEYLYFTEYEDMTGGGYTYNIIRYNVTDHTHTRIISLRDNIDLYPDRKEIKIYILDDSNLIIQRALPKTSVNGQYTGFFDFSLILFNFIKNKQIAIEDENLTNNGIQFILPYNETSCIMKTGYSLFEDNRHDILSKEEAAVESLIVLNIQQFISDLQLEQPNLVINAIDQSYYDTTIINAKINDNFLIYSKFNYENRDENIVFYNIDSKEIYTCINKTTSGKSLIDSATVIDTTPYMISRNSSGTQFFNLVLNETDTTYSEDFDIKFVNNTTLISSYTEKNFWGKEREMVAIHKFPSKKVILQERGEFIGAVASDSETTYIFLK